MPTLFSFKFHCSWVSFLKIIFVTLRKHNKIGSLRDCWFLLLKEKSRQKTNDSWNFGLVFLSKNIVSWPLSGFRKLVCWSPYYCSVLWVHAFRAKLSTKCCLERKNRHGRVWLIIALLFFGGRVQGSGEMASRATSLGPKPSFFLVCFSFWRICFV